MPQLNETKEDRGSASARKPMADDAQMRRFRRDAACFALDLGALTAAFVGAFLVRFEGSVPADMRSALIWTLPWVLVLQYGALVWKKVPSFSWVFVSIRDVPPIVHAHAVAALALLSLRYGMEALGGAFAATSLAQLPASVIVFDCALAILATAGVRGLRRIQRETLRVQKARRESRGAATVILGAGVAGRMLLNELNESASLGYRAVAFLDDDRAKIGRLVGGVKVEGTTDDLAEVAARHGARIALIAIAAASRASVHRIYERCVAAGMHTKIVPTLHELVSGDTPISQLRDVAIEDLLGRDPVEIDRSSAPGAIAGKVVLVTGAGGSIGSELCRQILRLEPERLVLVERYENNLYEIHRELSARPGGERIVPEIADVGDEPRMADLFAAYRPHVVFHAAAHKHVPMMERAPKEAIKNNVFGTKTVADLADRFGAERFVFVSTDKAVRPSSVMGATKRIAELYIKDLDARSTVRFTSVRFGNVMGSAGSVIPLFQEQIARGGPVTVTHPEMERFFMTIPEAARLVLEAAGLSEGGEVMLLDMGSPVKIRALAENMIRLSGREPYREVDIVFTGMRPGEKLQEELALPEEVLGETPCKKIFVWRGGASAVPMSAVLARLREPGRTGDEVRQALREALPEFRSPQHVAHEPLFVPVVPMPERAAAMRMAASS
jgi:FlaA1/EpsC-like NDP-sugar epimerase